MPSANNFTERITDRNLNKSSEQTIASSALLRIMQESESLYHNPSRTEWVQKKIDVFKDNLRSQITHRRDYSGPNSMNWPEEYAKMLREELEYIETCIEYNDKTGNVPKDTSRKFGVKKEKSKDKGIVIASHDISEPIEPAKAKPIKVIGHIDLNDSEDPMFPEKQ